MLALNIAGACATHFGFVVARLLYQGVATMEVSRLARADGGERMSVYLGWVE
jgi:hypothetical protein